MGFENLISNRLSSFPPHCQLTASKLQTRLSSQRVVQNINTSIQCSDWSKEKIKKMFDNIELSVSSYDTAWLAMVPSPTSPEAPCFPECSIWIVENQLSDGSWSLPQRHPSLIKDALSSTLACILALKQWGIGEEQINKGLQFIEKNSTFISDEPQQHAPIGFDIIFPSMIESARNLNLNIPFSSTDIDAMIRRRSAELRSINLEKKEAYLAYVSEGVGQLQDWEMVMKYQRKNGSLFNSPSTTAAAYTHLLDPNCLRYLQSLLKKFGSTVPTIYPLDIYARLCMVDSLERLGIERHFREEIKSVLDNTYRCWQQGEEEIFLDSVTCALAFRLLRVNGYEVSSDKLTQIPEVNFRDQIRGYPKDMGAVLELYRASQIVYTDESPLDKLNAWTSHFLREELSKGLSNADGLQKHIMEEVQYAINFPYRADLERLAIKRNIEQYRVDSNTRILKTSYRCSNLGGEDYIKLAVEDFNICQSLHRSELEHLGRWVVEKRLDKLKFARQKLGYCYFSSAATMFSPELSDARISWAKNGVLTTVVDDFFDLRGSEEELTNLVQLIEKWDMTGSDAFCSEEVEILYSALHSTICEIGEKTSVCQGRNVTSHVTKIWLDLLKSMLTESRWTRNKHVPTLDEYMRNGYVSFALGPIVLPALYFVGPKLSDDDARSPELQKLFEVMSTCGRLLNDLGGFKREAADGKLNAVSLHMIHGNGLVSEEEAISRIKGLIDHERKHLLRLVLQEKDSRIARPCRDLFWKMARVVHLFYLKDDGFTSNELMSVANAVINEPISLEKL